MVTKVLLKKHNNCLTVISSEISMEGTSYLLKIVAQIGRSFMRLRMQLMEGFDNFVEGVFKESVFIKLCKRIRKSGI